MLEFILLCISAVSAFENNEIKVGLFENVLTGCKHFNTSSIYVGGEP